MRWLKENQLPLAQASQISLTTHLFGRILTPFSQTFIQIILYNGIYLMPIFLLMTNKNVKISKMLTAILCHLIWQFNYNINKNQQFNLPDKK